MHHMIRLDRNDFVGISGSFWYQKAQTVQKPPLWPLCIAIVPFCTDKLELLIIGSPNRLVLPPCACSTSAFRTLQGTSTLTPFRYLWCWWPGAKQERKFEHSREVQNSWTQFAMTCKIKAGRKALTHGTSRHIQAHQRTIRWCCNAIEGWKVLQKRSKNLCGIQAEHGNLLLLHIQGASSPHAAIFETVRSKRGTSWNLKRNQGRESCNTCALHKADLFFASLLFSLIFQMRKYQSASSIFESA